MTPRLPSRGNTENNLSTIDMFCNNKIYQKSPVKKQEIILLATSKYLLIAQCGAGARAGVTGRVDTFC